MQEDNSINYEKIFHDYTKYRCGFYNDTMSFDNHIFKFKDKVNSFNKMLKEMELKTFTKKENEPFQIIVKEGKNKTIYSDSKENKDLNNEEPKNEAGSEPKKPNEIEAKGEKSFVVLGGFKVISDVIQKRGWKECNEIDVKTCNFLYTLLIKDIPFEDLSPETIVNHFRNGKEITIKANLLKNIRNLFFVGICPDNFYPRAYDLSIKSEIEDFMEDFKTTRAISILKNCKELKGINVNRDEVTTSLNIIKKKLNLLIGNIELGEKFKTVNTRIFSKNHNKNNQYNAYIVTDKEWEIISNENMEVYHNGVKNLSKLGMINEEKTTKKSEKNISGKKSFKPKEIKNKKKEDKNTNKKNVYVKTEEDKKLEEEIKANFKKQEEQREIERKKIDEIILEKELEREKKEKEKELKLLKEEEEEKKLKEKEDAKIPLTEEEKEEKWKKETFIGNTSNNERPKRLPQTDNVSDLLPEIEKLLKELSENQAEYVFEGSKNIWIVKPGGLSRGRGVNCIDQLNDILSNISPGNRTIIQKYIENPLVIKGRKFDIRQWVLVTDLNPLTIYLFDTPYIRFGAEEYHLEDFKNVFSQLTGNSIAKHSEKFGNSEIDGDMWETEQFREYIKKTYNKDHWPEIQEKIKKIVIYALECAKHKIYHRKNTFEVFGFDIMIDELLNVYLIEINLSPDWSFSTKVTEKLVKIASEDLMKVVLDLPNENLKPEEQRKNVDTGRFKLIYSSSKFPEFQDPNVNIKKY